MKWVASQFSHVSQIKLPWRPPSTSRNRCQNRTRLFLCIELMNYIPWGPVNSKWYFHFGGWNIFFSIKLFHKIYIFVWCMLYIVCLYAHACARRHNIQPTRWSKSRSREMTHVIHWSSLRAWERSMSTTYRHNIQRTQWNPYRTNRQSEESEKSANSSHWTVIQ